MQSTKQEFLPTAKARPQRMMRWTLPRQSKQFTLYSRNGTSEGFQAFPSLTLADEDAACATGGVELQMRLIVNRAECVGNARCHAVAPHLYPLDDDGYVAIEGMNVPEGEETAARNGARACPERIIRIVEEDG